MQNHASENPRSKVRSNSPASEKKPDFREISILQLDEPLHAARETFDDDKLDDLIQSIRVQGLIEPLIVKPEGKRFRILAGHRRFIACRALGFKAISCIVRSDISDDGISITVHENEYREDLNVAEQARYYGRLIDRVCGGDVDKLCELVKQKRDYVEARIVLLRGDPDVFAALAGNAISLGVAQELNKVKNVGRRKVFLDAALSGGCTIRMARTWRIDSEKLDEYPADLENLSPTNGATPMNNPGHKLECAICESEEEPHTMEVIFVHRTCKRLTLDKLKLDMNGGDNA